MPRAIVSPEEVRRFAALLEEASARLRASKNALAGSATALGEVWKDEKYTRFHREMEAAQAELEQFLREAEAYTRFLRTKAGKAQRYLDQ